MRVASLLPSATEIVCALGARHTLVARSHECDFPADIGELPACTTSKLVEDGSAYDIDERVRAILEQGLSIYRVDAALLRKLRPDVIVTQDHCEVCAASLADLEAVMCHLLDPIPELVVLRPLSLEDVLEDVGRIGSAVQRLPSATQLVGRMRVGMDAVRNRLEGVAFRPTVGLVEWLAPPMLAGNWMPTLVDMAGGTPVLARAGEHSPRLDWQAFTHADPDVIIVIPCGFGLERTAREWRALTLLDGWAALSAVRRGRVYLADGSHYFNRPGPRLVDSVEILAEILHPDRFPPRHLGHAWLSAS